MPNILANAAAAATYNIILQLSVRVVTFVLNAFILRYISKQLLGVVNVRLFLLYNTIIFLSREAFRRACLNKASAEKQWKQVINLLWCTLPISIVCGIIFGYIWAKMLEQPDETISKNYTIAVFCFALAAVIKITSEPLFITAQILLYVRLTVIIEASAIASRCFLTVILVLFWPHLGVLNFCIAQLCFSLVTSAAYYIYFTYALHKKEKDPNLPFQSARDFFPQVHKPLISNSLSKLTWCFAKHSILKQVINEGELYVMTFFHVIKLADQGIFDVVTNLGSLAGRFIFLPLEDSGYLFFSQTLSRGKPATQQEKESLELSTEVLETLLKMVIWIGLTILCFGYSYSYLLLDLYGGSILSSGIGPNLLRWFCVYVVLMAINGITECFAAATMSQSELDQFNRRVLVSSLIYLTALTFLCKLMGSVGLIFGNCLHYLARISFSYYHISHFYTGTNLKPMKSVMPKLPVVIVFVLCWIITTLSEVMLCCDKGIYYRLAHIAIGGICLLCLIIVTYKSEHKVICFIKQQYIASKTTKHKQS